MHGYAQAWCELFLLCMGLVKNGGKLLVLVNLGNGLLFPGCLIEFGCVPLGYLGSAVRGCLFLQPVLTLSRWVQDSQHISLQEPIVPAMADAWAQGGLFPCFCPIFPHLQREGIFPEGNEWVVFIHSGAEREKQARSRTKDMEPLPDPFDWQPIQGAERWSWIRWQEARAEKALCLQTYCQKCHGYNWNTSIAINKNKSLAPAIQKEQKSRPGGSEGEETIEDGNTITTLALPASLPLHLLLLCPFPFSLRYSICSSLLIFLYAIEGKPLICARAFALVLEAEVEQDYLLSSFFPQLVPSVSVEFQIVIPCTSA